MEPPSTSTSNGNGIIPEDLNDKGVTQEYLQQIMAFLRKNGLQEAEEVLSREASLILRVGDTHAPISSQSTHESINDEFGILLKQVESSFDFFQAEFSLLLFPVFAHAYLKLLHEANPTHAYEFLEKFAPRVPAPYEEQVDDLRRIKTAHQVVGHVYAQQLLKGPFLIKMSKSCIKQLENCLIKTPTIRALMKDHILIEPSDVISKMKSSVECQMGGIMGQISKNEKRHKMLYGVMKDDVSQAIEKKKMKGKELKDVKKNQAVAPIADRIPLPPLSELMREERKKAMRDAQKMTLVSLEQPPSVCMFTALNGHGGITSCDMTDDTTMLALGYGDSAINVYALDENQKIKRLKEMDELEKVDQEADNLTELLYDESTATTSVSMVGHGGPVYSVNFSPDKRVLVSSAKDNTIRLWSTDTQTNVVVYRTSMPVWQVQFCNRGYYFCSGGSDGNAALWCTDRMHPLRLFPDSFGHVSCVDFHPNCNYIAGGSDDRYVRVWDVLSGTCVRTFGGHKSPVRGVKVSPDGRYIVSVGGDGAVCVWDVAYHRLAGMESKSVQGTMASISFSRDGGAFAVSYGGPSVSIYSLDNLIAATSNSSNNEFSFDPKINMPGFNMFTYATKQTPVLGLHFTRRNLLLAVGSFNQ